MAREAGHACHLYETLTCRDDYLCLVQIFASSVQRPLRVMRDCQGVSADSSARAQGYRARYESSQAPRAVDEYCKIAAKYGVTPAQLALGFVQSRPFVPSTIIGATSVEQLEVRHPCHRCFIHPVSPEPLSLICCPRVLLPWCEWFPCCSTSGPMCVFTRILFQERRYI